MLLLFLLLLLLELLLQVCNMYLPSCQQGHETKKVVPTLPLAYGRHVCMEGTKENVTEKSENRKIGCEIASNFMGGNIIGL